MSKIKILIFFLLGTLLVSTLRPVPLWALSCNCDQVHQDGEQDIYFSNQCVDIEPNTKCDPVGNFGTYGEFGTLSVVKGTQYYSAVDGYYKFSSCKLTPQPCLTPIDKTCKVDTDCQVIPNRKGLATCTDGTCMVDSDLAQYWKSTNYLTQVDFKPPQLEIRIPGVDFTKNPLGIDHAGFLTIPYLVEYIKAVYKFLVIAGSIVAALVVILNGFRITVSAGGEAKGEGIKRVGQAVVGLSILWSSYAILYTINPNLTNLDPIRVKYLVPVNNDVYYGTGVEDSKNVTEITTPIRFPVNKDLQKIFEVYSQCNEPGPAVLTALAKVESNLNPNVMNGLGFTGLFQTKSNFCATALNQFLETDGYCSDLRNPEINTMVGASMMRTSLDKIKTNCGQLDSLEPDLLVTLIYTGHQSGPGALSSVTAKMYHNCTTLNLRKALIEFWSTPKNLKTLSNSGRTPEEVANEATKTAIKMIGAVNGQGGLNLKKEDFQPDKLCPLDVPSLRFQN